MGCIKFKKPIRSHTGKCWTTNSSNKQRLAKDFENKCAYCDDNDGYSGGYNNYHVEHFAPKEKFKDLEFVYDNLLYSCPYCNISKSNKWPSDKAHINIVKNTGFVDPCTDEYYIHLQRDDSGEIIYTTEIGKYIYYALKLFLKRHRILHNLERVRTKKKLLKAKIGEKKIAGEDVALLEDLYKELCVIFCEYYDLFFELEE